jgi:hypothetical protein
VEWPPADRRRGQRTICAVARFVRVNCIRNRHRHADLLSQVAGLDMKSAEVLDPAEFENSMQKI